MALLEGHKGLHICPDTTFDETPITFDFLPHGNVEISKLGEITNYHTLIGLKTLCSDANQIAKTPNILMRSETLRPNTKHFV